MRRWLIAAWLIGAGLWAPLPGGAEGEILLDRIVAVVDDDPIFLSDIRRVIGLGLATASAGESEDDLERRILDGLIDQRLRFHSVERYELGPLPAGELDRQLAQIRSSFEEGTSPEGGPLERSSAFEQRLAELGLDPEGLRHLLARQLRVVLYIEERLGPRIFVDLEEIHAYYEGELTRQAATEGLELPPLEAVREEIRALLREVRLNDEIASWTEELRQEAAIVDHLDRRSEELPPVLRRFE